MHRKRWITGLIAFPILVVVAAAAVLTLYEYNQAVFTTGGNLAARLIPLVGVGLAPLIVWLAFTGNLAAVPLIIAVDLILVSALTLTLFKDDTQAPYLVAKQVLGLAYITVPLAFLVTIRADPKGLQWIMWILCTVFAGDIGAFYTGTYLGRHKLCPWVSPQKTIEGSLGGLAANTLVALVLKMLLLPTLNAGPCIIFALVVGVGGQLGDLFASEFKRSAGIKDSGILLPGHGGLLDRLDALLFAAPLAYLFKITIF
ncbi:MAG: phosphatidate cytidylyltransferase [Proteobacteria bacterium]|nr:MAG: phosphatidate cytidylyltransferase [Pseudomonadota bacterium]